jgi:ferric-dicitrate binding protein FerR (iron transport regulator)
MGEQVTATLPDGSTVELNSGTSLSYPRGFQAWPFVDAASRTVRLDGEAYFDVVSRDRSFVVETFNARVEVLGTTFNVRARSQAEASTQVTVASGRVRVSPSQRPTAAVVLKTPGETSRVTKATTGPTQPAPTSVERTLIWRRNGFSVSGLPLPAVVQELERRYNVTIQLDASVEETTEPISLYYPKPRKIETIISDVCTARGLKYRPTSRGFLIYDDGS